MDRKIIDDTKAEIEALVTKKKNEIEKINNELKKAHAELTEALDEQKQASDEMNAKAYAAACRRVADAESVIGMYEMRRDTLKAQEMISDEDSDKKIDALLQYEKDIEQEYTDLVREHIKAINEIYKEYNKNVRDTENVIDDWTRRVHPNFRRPGTTLNAEAIAKGEDRKPWPVHKTYYDGGKLNAAIKNTLGMEVIKILIE